ncbi:MAG TPA: hypothetical protein VKQ71_16885 [Acidimicrobiales bacterium]|nr:hypothetical protein [Acidimicrobiales bacterium]
MTEKDPVVVEDEEQLEHLDEEINTARRHLKEQTHEGQEYFYEDAPPDKGETDAPG